MTMAKGQGHALLWALLAGAIAGILCGWFAGPAMQSVAWVGTVFLNALKMTIVPLLIVAVITGVAGLGGAGRLGRIGGITVLYYASTTALAVLMGLVLVNLIEPGTGASVTAAEPPPGTAERAEQGIPGIFLQMVAPSLAGAAAGNQLLPVILFSLFLGIALLRAGESGRPVIAFCEGVNEALMTLVQWIMYLAPIGVFALIAARLGQAGGQEGILRELQALGWYMFTVALGLLLHFGALFCILRLLSGRGLRYLDSLAQALITAFGTASSSATLPLTIRCVTMAEVDPRSARFVLPLGATMNMDGTALYEAVAAMFIAQVYGIDMSLTQQCLIFLTATLAAVGAAGIPQAGLVTMIIVLTAVGLPLEGIGLLLTVDWLLDRMRTTVNVWGDSVGAAVVERFLVVQAPAKAPAEPSPAQN